MAEITSSSVTSSVVPAKLVSRRSIRMVRLLSALPRRAWISCLRSVSLRGRKSIGDSSYRKGTYNFPSVGKSFPGVRLSDLGGQLGHQEIDSLVDALRRAVDGKDLSPTKHVVTDI